MKRVANKRKQLRNDVKELSADVHANTLIVKKKPKCFITWTLDLGTKVNDHAGERFKNLLIHAWTKKYGGERVSALHCRGPEHYVQNRETQEEFLFSGHKNQEMSQQLFCSS